MNNPKETQELVVSREALHDANSHVPAENSLVLVVHSRNQYTRRHHEQQGFATLVGSSDRVLVCSHASSIVILSTQ
jgi:hypothetical protein